MKSIGDFCNLLYLFIVVRYKLWVEEWLIRHRFYLHKKFQELDLQWKKAYRFQNPYRISKLFLQQKGEKLVDAYGETPLTSFYQIFQEIGLTSEDCFLDLGSGRGRGVFFAAAYFQCRAIGIEQIPSFVLQCRKIAERCSFNQAHFVCSDIFDVDLSSASILYFYGICMPDEQVKLLVSRLENLSETAKVISVSFPLSDYSTLFSVEKQFVVRYPWGSTEVFINRISLKKGEIACPS